MNKQRLGVSSSLCLLFSNRYLPPKSPKGDFTLGAKKGDVRFIQKAIQFSTDGIFHFVSKHFSTTGCKVPLGGFRGQIFSTQYLYSLLQKPIKLNPHKTN